MRGVVDQITVVHERGEIGERAADIPGEHPKQQRGGGHEETDLELLVQKDRRDPGAFQNVLKIVGGFALERQRLVKLVVQSVEFFVGRRSVLVHGPNLFGVARKVAQFVEESVDGAWLWSGNAGRAEFRPIFSSATVLARAWSKATGRHNSTF